jgi:hypothetical protein
MRLFQPPLLGRMRDVFKEYLSGTGFSANEVAGGTSLRA